jgi:hypothetical protein
MFRTDCAASFNILFPIDLTSSDVLQDISKTVGWNVNVEEVIQIKGKTLLKDNTKEALDYGAFGVPRYDNIYATACDILKDHRRINFQKFNVKKKF